MTWTIELSPRAEAELADAQDWYEARREGLGRRFFEAVDAMLVRIAAGPQAFHAGRMMRATSAPCWPDFPSS
jgi:hypothetical protein